MDSWDEFVETLEVFNGSQAPTLFLNQTEAGLKSLGPVCIGYLHYCSLREKTSVSPLPVVRIP